MATATSGTTTFNPPVTEYIEEAFERCGSESRTGYDIRTARRSMNLLLLDWGNRGINMWTIDSGSILLVQGTLNYALPADTVDLLDFDIRTGSGQGQQDISVARISESTYSTIPNKNVQGRPLQVWIDRQGGAVSQGTTYAVPQINIWPVPDGGGPYTFVYWRIRRMQDVGSAGYYGVDIPFRFIPALVAGLAYYMAFKIPSAYERIPTLKSVYDEAWLLASEEDREKAPVRLVPRMTRVGGSA